LFGGGTTFIAGYVHRVRNSVVEIITDQSVLTLDKKVMMTKGLGSGVIVSEDGEILTVVHVAQTAESVKVKFSGGEVVSGKIISSEPAADVALVKVESLPKSDRAAKVGNSNLVRVGDKIFIIGAPYGLSHTLTVGHISAR
jgi:S1-C subfamily serine protease